jgi:hypothetical protein
MQTPGTILEIDRGGGNSMGTINQPKPSEPKSPQPDPAPLQPSGPPERSHANTDSSERVDPQHRESKRDKFGDT